MRGETYTKSKITASPRLICKSASVVAFLAIVSFAALIPSPVTSLITALTALTTASAVAAAASEAAAEVASIAPEAVSLAASLNDS
jgi:hypothetical protein